MQDIPENKNDRSLSIILINNFLSRKEQFSKHYKVACAWSGAIKLAGELKEKKLLEELIDSYKPFANSYKELLAGDGHVDNNVFGIVPLEIFMQTGDKTYLAEGLELASHQITNLNKQIRYAIDDMFMIPRLQLMAYKACKKLEYLETAGSVLTLYINRLQQPDGLFFHHPDFKHKWGRGNGWVAAGMATMLPYISSDKEAFKVIKNGYLAMMKGLKETQIQEGSGKGLWKQIVDSQDKRNWPETSASAMFAYAILCGLRLGVLDPSEYNPVWKEAWNSLKEKIDANGNLTDISNWAYKPESHPNTAHLYLNDEENYYFERERLKGDFHGQAPILWGMIL